MNVLVMGAGGVGGYLGALLARTGHSVAIVARGAHLDAIRRNGLRIETAAGPPFTVKVQAAETANALADLVLFAVKSYDTQQAIRLVQPAVGPDTIVLTLQNGIGSGDELAEAFGWERVLDGVIYIESYVKAPGTIDQAGGPRRVIFGRRGGNGEREQALLETLRAAGWEAELADNILNALWTKLLFIGPYAAFNTITGLKGAQLASDPNVAGLVRTAIAEYAAVGNAEGAGLTPDTMDATFARFRDFGTITSSMFRDRLAGRPIESGTLVDVVVARGEALGVPTPVTTMLSALLSPMREGNAIPTS